MTNDKQRERLVELIIKGNNQPCGNGYPWEDNYCKGCEYEGKKDCRVLQLADYLLANVVIVPPVKVGQTVYRVVVMSTGVNKVFKRALCPPYTCETIINCKPTIKRFIRSVVVTKNNFLDVVENWGKTVFPTKEEAEEVLGGADNA